MRGNPRDVMCEGILNYIVSVQLLELWNKDTYLGSYHCVSLP
jgi:hypothetical protein